jgi:AraC-like DNA-binding protein
MDPTSPIYADLRMPVQLQAGVRRISYFREMTERGTIRREPPRGFVTLIICLADPIGLSPPGTVASPLKAFAVGAGSGVFLASCGANNSGIEVQLRPWFAQRLLGGDVFDATSGVKDVTSLLPAGLDGYGRRSAITERAQVDLLIDWLLRRTAGWSEHTRPDIVEAWNLLEISAGTVNIDAIAGHVGLSHRHFKEVFLAATGLRPKQAARRLRFGHAIELIESIDELPLCEVAYVCGYSDQSHLTREFQSYAEISPFAFKASRLTELQGFEMATA